MSNIGALRDALAHVEPGATFHLGVVRGDAVLTLDVERPEVQAGAIGDIDERQLRELIERLQRGEIRLEQLPLQLRQLLERFAPREQAPQRVPSRS